jgi:hypothetical protein
MAARRATSPPRSLPRTVSARSRAHALPHLSQCEQHGARHDRRQRVSTQMRARPVAGRRQHVRRERAREHRRRRRQRQREMRCKLAVAQHVQKLEPQERLARLRVAVCVRVRAHTPPHAAITRTCTDAWSAGAMAIASMNAPASSSTKPRSRSANNLCARLHTHARTRHGKYYSRASHARLSPSQEERQVRRRRAQRVDAIDVLGDKLAERADELAKQTCARVGHGNTDRAVPTNESDARCARRVSSFCAHTPVSHTRCHTNRLNTHTHQAAGGVE